VRVGLIGLGGVAGRIHLPACRAVPEIQVVGGCDPTEESRRRMESKFALPATFASAGEMIEKTRPELVIVGTPPGSHFELSHLALSMDCHVLCEKPFMTTVAEADQIIELARSKNRLLRVNNQYRFMPYYSGTKLRLDKGEFGRAFYLQAWQQMFHPPQRESNWRGRMSQYVLFEFGTHVLDLACYFYEALPDSISVVTPHPRAGFDSDVLVHVTLRFPGERLAVFSFNRISHAPEKYLEMRLDCEEASVRMSLGGVARVGLDWSSAARRPILRAGFLKGGEARVEKNGRSRSICRSATPQFASATAEHLRLFLSEMLAPVPRLEAVRQSREILAAVLAGYESATTGETVWLRPKP